MDFLYYNGDGGEEKRMMISVKKRKGINLLRPEIAAVVAAGFILAFILMRAPVIGVADNGDFERIMNKVNLTHMTDNYNDNFFGYATRQFKIIKSIPILVGYFSTEVPVLAAAVAVNKSVSSNGIFDIRFLSAIYSLIFLAAIYLIVRYAGQKAGRIGGWLLAALVVFVFADIGYITYFNSLYGEAVSLVFLLLAAGAAFWIASAEEPKLYMLIIFFAGIIMFVGAKIQNSPLAIPAALLGLGMLKLRHDKLWKRTVIISIAVTAAVAGLSYFMISPDIKVCNKYQTVFYGILKDSPNPEKDLEELGLDSKLAVLAGTNYFMKSYPLDIRSESFKQDIYKNVSHLKIAAFYLRHPDRLINKLQVAAFNGFYIKNGMGNFEKAPGITYKQTANIMNGWSEFKSKIIPHSLFFVVLFFAVFFIVLIYVFIRYKDVRNRLMCGTLMLIGVIGLSQFVLPVIGDGEADLSKHLFLFNVGFDMMFVVMATALAAWGTGLLKLLGRRINS